MPAVTIVVPCYNHADFIGRRLESVFRQSFTDYEVIILDDASTDSSREVIVGYLSRPGVCFLENCSNSGSPSIQWNRGAAQGSGRYIWIAESDDFADPDFLSVLVPILDDNPRVGLAYSQSRAVDAAGNIIGDPRHWFDDLARGRWLADYYSSGQAECAHYLLWKNTVPNASAALFRRSVFRAAGGSPEKMRLCGDWMTWVRMLLISDISFTARPLNFFRQHTATVRATTGQRQFSFERWAVRSLISRKCPLPRSVRRELARSTFGELLWLARQDRGATRIGTLFRGLRSSWPILIRSPFGIFARGTTEPAAADPGRPSG